MVPEQPDTAYRRDHGPPKRVVGQDQAETTPRAPDKHDQSSAATADEKPMMDVCR